MKKNGLRLLVVLTLVLPNFLIADDKLKSTILSSPPRPADEVKRDKYRKPEQVLQLLDLKPGMRVVDLVAGGGYYSELLARVVGNNGLVVSHNPPYVINRFANFLHNPKQGWLARFETPIWKNCVIKNTDELDTINLPMQIDAVLMVLFYHDTVWQGVNRSMMNRRIFNVLKPGGTYLVIDHNAKGGRGIMDAKSLHRIDKQTVINEITSVGFELAIDSSILLTIEDTRDYSFVRDVKLKRDQTDRMVLKFIKPKS
ncbi:class I SAM-dependent methyltransferase [Aliikangiella maris]|uniref:Uncharacterized protein n=2 Tax=Aliikangiella maris TaxID=3162458 RepID=A0ABV3MKE6_9GAMM